MILGALHVFMRFPITLHSEKVTSAVLPSCCPQWDVGCYLMAVFWALTLCRIVGLAQAF